MRVSRRQFLHGGFCGRDTWLPQAKISASCIAMTGIACRACDDACAPRAIRFASATRGIEHPQIDLAACNGCGDCETACPVGAITLRRADIGQSETATGATS